MSIFVSLLADDEYDQLLDHVVIQLIQQLLFRYMHFSEQLLALCAVFHGNNEVLLDIERKKEKKKRKITRVIFYSVTMVKYNNNKKIHA
jgi:hypothetical protein